MTSRPPGRQFGYALLVLAGLALLAPVHAGSDPYLNHRDAELGYHGPSEDLAGLTELRIGWFGPSDPDDPVDGDLWFAASLAIADANAPRSGSAHPSPIADRPSPLAPLRLVPRWSVDPWGTGVSQLTRMIYDEQPLALLGSIDSASTHLAEQVVAKAQLPLVSPIATDPSLTLAGVSWMFSCAPSDDAIARALVGAVLASASTATTAAGSSPATRPTPFLLLSTTDHESRMTTRSVLRACSHRGYLPALHLEIEPGTADLTAQMRAAAEVQPRSVVIIAGVEDAARLTRAVRGELGAVALFGGPSMARRRFTELAGPAAEGVVVPALFAPDAADATTAEFVARFTAARGHTPDYSAALTYDATRLLAAAICRGGPNRARIRQSLSDLSPWTGVTGTIAFDGTGQNSAPTVPLGRIHDEAVCTRPPQP